MDKNELLTIVFSVRDNKFYSYFASNIARVSTHREIYDYLLKEKKNHFNFLEYIINPPKPMIIKCKKGENR